MWQHAGILRTKRELTKGLAEIKILQKEIKRIGLGTKATYAKEWRHYQDMASILTICEAIIRSALFRTESRGAHARTDFPRKEKKWQHHVCCVKGKRGIQIFTRPVIQPRGALLHFLKKEGLL
jgi:succinate dehydrogenase / fumarate reductase flavoprotein subunit